MPGWYEFGWFVMGVTVGAVVTQGIRWVDWIRLRRKDPNVEVTYTWRRPTDEVKKRLH
jgi:hypothetical protein